MITYLRLYMSMDTVRSEKKINMVIIYNKEYFCL